MVSKLVSVIVPVYNAEKYLSDCVESLLVQSYRPFELIFVNDGSTDSSQALLEHYAARHDCMRVVYQKNMGVSGARNAALDLARGAYIAFCDSDDVVHADWLAELVSALESVDAQMACCSYAPFENGSAPEYTQSDVPLKRSDNLADMYRGVLCADDVRGYLFNKLFVREIIEFEPKLRFRTDLFILEDQVFVMEYMNRISSCCYLGSRLYGYRNTPGSALKQKLNDRQMTSLQSRRRICRLAEKTADPMLKQIAADQLTKATVYWFQKAVLSAAPSKFRWMRQITQLYREESAVFHSRNQLSFKDCILLSLLKIAAHIVK